MWHACLPALTLAPDLRTAAVLTLAATVAAALPPRARADGTAARRLARAWPWAVAVSARARCGAPATPPAPS